MQNEDQHMDRSPDLVAKVRKLRQEAEKKMNRFTCVADYDVRYVQGHGPKPTWTADETMAAEPVISPAASVAHDRAEEES